MRACERSNAPADAPIAKLLRVAFCRWNIVHTFRVAKTEIGFRHFEGRSYTGLMRHLTLCQVTLTFVAGRAEELRGEKPGGDGGAGLPRAELDLRPLAGEPAQDESPATPLGCHSISPAA